MGFDIVCGSTVVREVLNTLSVCADRDLKYSNLHRLVIHDGRRIERRTQILVRMTQAEDRIK